MRRGTGITDAISLDTNVRHLMLFMNMVCNDVRYLTTSCKIMHMREVPRARLLVRCLIFGFYYCFVRHLRTSSRMRCLKTRFLRLRCLNNQF